MCTIHGLKVGSRFDCRARVHNAHGVSGFGDHAPLRTKSAAPCVPRDVVATALDSESSAEIEWRLPEFDGGTAIFAYMLEMQCLGDAHHKHDSILGEWEERLRLESQAATAAEVATESECKLPATSAKLTGLSSGHRYRFRVRAENSSGVSEPSVVDELCEVRMATAAPLEP